jgi:hypothetical protein
MTWPNLGKILSILDQQTFSAIEYLVFQAFWRQVYALHLKSRNKVLPHFL